MGRDGVNVLMLALLVADLGLLLVLLRGARVTSDIRSLLLFLLSLVK